MSHRAQIVTFFLTCSESRAWLVINSDSEDARVVEMWSGYPNHWSASAWLKPGDYRCRYYGGDEHCVNYHSPAHLIGGGEAGMDGLVSITILREKMNPNPIAILLVEDNLTTLTALEKLLSQDGYVVHVAEGYQTALDVAKRERLDFAICDINLWDGDGCDLLGELKALHPLQAIAVTGYTLPDEAEHYRDAGFAAVLKKPVHHTEIISALALLASTAGANPSAAPISLN